MTIAATKEEQLVICVNEPPRVDGKELPRFLNGWRGVLECKAKDWTLDQIVSHMGKPEYVERILKIGKHGAVENITDFVLDHEEATR